MKTLAVAWSGASGLPYGLRLVDCLLAAGCRVWLTYSPAAQDVARQEAGLSLASDPAAATEQLVRRFGATSGALRVFGHQDWQAPPASGSNPPDACVICPCSMNTLAEVAQGGAQNLIGRSAAVALKEGRPLVLVPRETPLSVIHLENMLRLARAGAVILPPCPGFYHRPSRIDDLVDFVVARILDRLGVPHALLPRWGEVGP